MCNLKICENCANLHDGKYGSGRFCTNKCARGFSTKQKRSLINEKVSKSLTKQAYKKICLFCNIEFETKRKKYKYCSISCSNKHVTDETKAKISKSVQNNIKNGTHKGWQSRKKRSYAELFFENVLVTNNIRFSAEYKINKKLLNLNDSSNYFLDFYLYDYNVNLEIDGKQHEYKERKISDNIRDNALTNYGLIVYRIKWKNPYKNEEYIKNEINKLIIFLKNLNVDQLVDRPVWDREAERNREFESHHLDFNFFVP